MATQVPYAAVPPGIGSASGGGLYQNVRTFGAVGDGVTDDSVAIQAAIDAATSGTGGGVVFPSPGQYLCAGLVADITPPAGGGSGPWLDLYFVPGASLVQKAGSTGTLLHIEGGGFGNAGLNSFTMENAILVGNGPDGSWGLVLSGCQHATVTNLTASNFTNPAGISLAGAPVLIDSNCASCVLDNPILFNNQNGLYLSGNANTVKNGWIINNAFYGVEVQGENNAILETIVQGSAHTGVSLDNGTTHAILTGLYLEANGVYDIFDNSDFNVIDSCWFSVYNTTTEIWKAGGSLLTVRDPYFQNPATLQIHAPAVISGANSTLLLANITNTVGGALRLYNNLGINPVGSVAVAIPASGTVVAAVPYDQWLYVTASTSTIAVAVTDAGGTSQTVATIPASTYAPVFVPAGSSWTLTYATAPTALTAQGL